MRLYSTFKTDKRTSTDPNEAAKEVLVSGLIKQIEEKGRITDPRFEGVSSESIRERVNKEARVIVGSVTDSC